MLGWRHVTDPTLPKMAERILAQAPPTFALGGVSMGGMVALEIMKMAPERVTRLALVDTSARPDRFGQQVYRGLSNLVVGLTCDFRRLAERSLPSLIHPQAPQDVRDDLVEMSVRVGAKVYVRQNRRDCPRRPSPSAFGHSRSHRGHRRRRRPDDASADVARDLCPDAGSDTAHHPELLPPAAYRKTAGHGGHL